MALNATLWRVNTDKSIEYIGGDHGTATANYVTVLELPLKLYCETIMVCRIVYQHSEKSS